MLCTVRSASNYWKLSEPGFSLMHARVSCGYNAWIPTPRQQHRYLIDAMPPEAVGKIIEDLMIQQPGRAVRHRMGSHALSVTDPKLWITMTKILIMLLFGLATAQFQVATASEAAALKVAAVQMRSSRSLAENVSRITNSIHKCAQEGVRVVVFPECALSGYYPEVVTNLSAEAVTAAEEQVAEACRTSRTYAVVGSAWRDGDRLFDSALIFVPAGTVIERYHKIQLAERWPQVGDHLSVFRIDGVPCSVIICHDERYPELVRLPVLAGAKVIFYLSHESGLREEKKVGPYRAQIQARAVENTVFVIQANAPANLDASGSHGQSRIIAPDGNILQEASIFQEDVLVQTLDPHKATRANALNSLKRGPLCDWWQDGVKRVRLIE